MTTVQDTEAFVRFAKVHLPTNAERAIYPVLAADSDREWTAGEVAAAARVSHHEADQALRRFASAGVVDHSHVRGQGHRYRWHPDMSYLRQGFVSGSAIDPVCGMPVPPRVAAHRPRRRRRGQLLFTSVPRALEVGPSPPSRAALISRQIPPGGDRDRVGNRAEHARRGHGFEGGRRERQALRVTVHERHRE